ncbi:hypothetical protein [Paractinoplanes globisporus]|uniref:FXSXX-COOH protein n=1 Tax=Paractinoplanes globisporus TaxID=113565 RepID=A0ABW6WS92_9ACTN|nr:hypothetical protein [Actinoplanes globisporus]
MEKTPRTPLDEARTAPIDRIDRAASAQVVRRIVRRDRGGVTPFSSGI